MTKLYESILVNSKLSRIEYCSNSNFIKTKQKKVEILLNRTLRKSLLVLCLFKIDVNERKSEYKLRWKPIDTIYDLLKERTRYKIYVQIVGLHEVIYY